MQSQITRGTALPTVLSVKSPGLRGGCPRLRLAALRICIVYDCLYPHTVGGAERWYRNLSERLADEGHEVTYLTLRQWERGRGSGRPRGARRSPSGRGWSSTSSGRRRIGPPLVFGFGVLRHLLRHGRRYDVVHTASFPYFSLLAAGPLRRGAASASSSTGTSSGRGLLARVPRPARRAGSAGASSGSACGSRSRRSASRASTSGGCARRACAATSSCSRASSRAQPRRAPQPAEPVVVFAGQAHPGEAAGGRSCPRSRARARRFPELRGEIYGDGPERRRCSSRSREHGLDGVVEAPGFVDGAVVERALDRALCLALPSRREGYGLVVLEAMSRGTPAVLVRGDDNAAAEFDRRRRERLRRGRRRQRTTLLRRSSACTRRATRSASRRSHGSSATRSGSRSSTRSTSSCGATPRSALEVTRATRILHVLPHPGGGGEVYMDALAGIEGHTFERVYLADNPDPAGSRADSPEGRRSPARCTLLRPDPRGRRDRKHALPTGACSSSVGDESAGAPSSPAAGRGRQAGGKGESLGDRPSGVTHDLRVGDRGPGRRQLGWSSCGPADGGDPQRREAPGSGQCRTAQSPARRARHSGVERCRRLDRRASGSTRIRSRRSVLRTLSGAGAWP